MSLNKFTDSVIKPYLKIGADIVNSSNYVTDPLHGNNKFLVTAGDNSGRIEYVDNPSGSKIRVFGRKQRKTSQIINLNTTGQSDLFWESAYDLQSVGITTPTPTYSISPTYAGVYKLDCMFTLESTTSAQSVRIYLKYNGVVSTTDFCETFLLNGLPTTINYTNILNVTTPNILIGFHLNTDTGALGSSPVIFSYGSLSLTDVQGIQV